MEQRVIMDPQFYKNEFQHEGGGNCCQNRTGTIFIQSELLTHLSLLRSRPDNNWDMDAKYHKRPTV